VSDTRLIAPPVEVAERTDPGRDPEKQVNEDACRCAETPFGHLAVLCDGMGGHEGGKEASAGAVTAVFRYLAIAPTRPDIPPETRAREVLKDAVAVANQEVFAMGSSTRAARPGSTLVALLVHPRGTVVAHVGDSRCYLVRAGAIRQLTRDHSMVQEMVDAGRLTEEEARVHPDANQITRALGMHPVVQVDESTIAHEKGDVLVLCSDGLSDLVGAAEIRDAVASASPAQSVDVLVDLANARGGHDNVTVMVLRVGAGAHAAEALRTVSLETTEAMAAVAPPSSGTLPGSPASPPTLHMPDGLASPRIPAAPPRRMRRRGPPAAVLGIVLGVVGIVGAGAVLVLVLTPSTERSDVPGLSLPVVLPAASLAPTPQEDGSAADAGPRVRRYRNRPHR